MKMTPRRLPWVAMMVVLLFHTPDAKGQLARGRSASQYNAAPSGGAYLPGLPGYPMNSVIYGRFGWNGPYTVSFPTANGRWTLPFDPRFPVNVSGFVANAPGGAVGYTTGGAASSSSASQTMIDARGVAPEPVRESVPNRKAFERWAADRDRARRPEPIQVDKTQELMAALANPSQGDMTSGNALNTILDALGPLSARLAETQPIPVDEVLLRKINFTRGAGSVGLLRDGGRINWPALLLNLEPKADSAKVRAEIDQRFQTAFNQVNVGGKADPENARLLLKAVDQLSDLVSARAQKFTFADNLEVRRFLKAVEDGVAFLRQPDAADWMPGKQKARPQSVQELVQLMIAKSVRFAPALPGNDGAYVALHRSLAGLYAQASAPAVRP